jgi:hypothetical protein
MNVLNNIINRLNYLIGEVPQKIANIPGDELAQKKTPGKWSKKEILGHLCDSAVNNLGRFIRAQFEQPFQALGYEQDDWVRCNHYQDLPKNDIVDFWKSINNRIVHVISKIPEEKLAVICNVGNTAFRDEGENKTLLWLIEDYVVHMEYHLNQIIEEDWLRSDYLSRK